MKARDFARAEARSRDGFDEERDWDENTPRNSTFDRTSDYNAASLRTSCRTDMRRAAEREGDALCSHSFSYVHGASDDFGRASSAHSDLRSRDTSFRASHSEASPLPGIARDSALRGDDRRSVEPSISREDRRSHASAPRGDGQRSVEPSISREDRRSHASERCSSLKHASQPRVREGIRREPDPPDDLFMDDL